MMGGLGNTGTRLLSDRHRATPSKLRIGSTNSDVGASVAAAAAAAAAALDMPGTPNQGQSLKDSLASLPPGLAAAAAAASIQQQEAAVAQAQAAAALDASAAAAAAGLFGGAPAAGTPQQLQAMYMAMSAGMYPPYGYNQQPFPGGYPPQGGFPGLPNPMLPGMPPPMGFPSYGHAGYPPAYPPGMDPMAAAAGIRPGMHFSGMPFPPVNPAEYAAYYQRYMETQAQAMAVAMAGGGPAGGPSMDTRDGGNHGVHRLDRDRDNGQHHGGGPHHTHTHDRPRGPAQSRQLSDHHDRRDGGADSRDGGARRRGSRREDRSVGDALLEEFKSNKARKFEFRDVLGHMHEFSLDQHGSRFIQQRLEVVPIEELDLAFQEVLPRIVSLMTDVFGNYVVQKFLEHGTDAHRTKIAETLRGQVREKRLGYRRLHQPLLQRPHGL